MGSYNQGPGVAASTGALSEHRTSSRLDRQQPWL